MVAFANRCRQEVVADATGEGVEVVEKAVADGDDICSGRSIDHGFEKKSHLSRLLPHLLTRHRRYQNPSTVD